MKDFENKQAKLDAYKWPLVFNYEVEITSLADVIYYLFFNGTNCRTGYKLANYIKVQPTGSYRSCEDTYRLAKSYLSGISLEIIFNTMNKLYSLADESIIAALNRWWCYNVGKQVYVRDNYKQVTKEYLNKYLDEKGLNYK